MRPTQDLPGMPSPELCKVAVLRTENPVLHPLPMLALEVAEAPAKEVVLVVKAVAATLDSGQVKDGHCDPRCDESPVQYAKKHPLLF